MLSKRFAPYPPESGSITFLVFWKGGLGGLPRGRGERGKTFCVPACFSCDIRGRIFFFSFFIKREENALSGFCKKRTLTKMAHLRKQADAQSGGSRSGPVATAADCTCIACLRALTKATVRACW